MGNQNFTQWTNADWCGHLTALDCDGAAFDLTGADAFMNIKTRAGVKALGLSLGNGLTIVDAAAGKIDITIPQAAMVTMPPDLYIYDVIVDTGGGRHVISHGTVHIRSGITGWPNIAAAAINAGAGLSAGIDRLAMGINFQVPHATRTSAAIPITSLLSCIRATSGWARQADGSLVEFGPGVLRITDKGLLIEESRTNLAEYSTDMTQWTVSSATLVDARNVSFPANGNHMRQFTRLGDAGTLAGKTFTASGRMRCTSHAQAGIYFYLHTGVMELMSASDTLTITSGWQEFSLTATLTAEPTYAGGTDVLFGLRRDDNTAGAIDIEIDYMQLEEAETASSFIQTTSAAVTRDADEVQFSDLTWLNAAQGTLLMEVDVLPVDAAGLIGYDGGNSLLARGVGALQAKADNGAAVVSANAGGAGFGAVSRLALAWNAAGRSICFNGGTVGSDANTAAPISRLDVGSLMAVSGFVNTHIRAISYWPVRKADTELQELTA